MYTDTRDLQRPSKVSSIANWSGTIHDITKRLPKPDVLAPTWLENIILYQPPNSEMQELVVEKSIPEVLAQSTDRRIKLIIVDSPITHYKTEYTGLSECPSKEAETIPVYE